MPEPGELRDCPKSRIPPPLIGAMENRTIFEGVTAAAICVHLAPSHSHVSESTCANWSRPPYMRTLPVASSSAMPWPWRATGTGPVVFSCTQESCWASRGIPRTRTTASWFDSICDSGSRVPDTGQAPTWRTRRLRIVLRFSPSRKASCRISPPHGDTRGRIHVRVSTGGSMLWSPIERRARTPRWGGQVGQGGVVPVVVGPSLPWRGSPLGWRLAWVCQSIPRAHSFLSPAVLLFSAGCFESVRRRRARIRSHR